jgi:hypothetical protein
MGFFLSYNKIMHTSNKISEYVESFDDWRGERLKELLQLINEAAPELTEDFKWGVPVWTHNGMVCAISAFKDHVKINFFKGAYLSDTHKVFNSGLDSKEHRSVNFSKDDELNKTALKELTQAAVGYNHG